MTVPKKKLNKMKRTPLLIIKKQQLKNPIFENKDEKENDKQDKWISEENRTQQARKMRQIAKEKNDTQENKTHHVR